jgi:hypothetical protein
MKKRSFRIFSGGCPHQLKFTQYNCLNIIFVIFLIVCFSIKSTGQSKYKNNDTLNPMAEENLGLKIFKAFQKGDDSLWVSLYPTNAEYRELTRLMSNAKIIKLPQSTIDEMLTRHDNEATPEYKKIFHIFLKQADSLGINWNDAVYQKLDFNSLYPEDFARKYMNGDIWFSCKNSHFIIEAIEAVEVSFGFKLQSIKSIRRVGAAE